MFILRICITLALVWFGLVCLLLYTLLLFVSISGKLEWTDGRRARVITTSTSDSTQLNLFLISSRVKIHRYSCCCTMYNVNCTPLIHHTSYSTTYSESTSNFQLNSTKRIFTTRYLREILRGTVTGRRYSRVESTWFHYRVRVRK